MKRKEVAPAPFDDAKSNLTALNQHRRKSPFHDQGIERIALVSKRMIVTLEDYTLVLTGVVDCKGQKIALPATWLYESITELGESYRLEVEAETGKFAATFANLRLLRNSDQAILIPRIDQ